MADYMQKFLNPNQDGSFGSAYEGRGGLFLSSFIHILAQLYLAQRKCKNIKYKNYVTHHLSSVDISIFSTKIRNLLYQIQVIFQYIISFNLLILLPFLESLKVILINMVAILMMLETLASLGLLKIKVFLNKEYDVVISVHDITKKNLIT